VSTQPVRVLHAADLRVDQPVGGLTKAPEHLRDLLIDAPYRAAEQVFETAIRQDVAMVVLSGNVMDLVTPTARALAFLRDQLQRLSDHGIEVFWAGGTHDGAAHWPRSVTLPDRAHHFGAPVTEHACDFPNLPNRVVVLGCSRQDASPICASDFERVRNGSFSIAAVSGDADARSLSAMPIEYWALGGHARETLFSDPHVAHYPGSPQGRKPGDAGPHGCTLVEVSGDDAIRLRFMPCDAVRWHHERVTIRPRMTAEDVDRVLADRMRDMRSQVPLPMLVKWTFHAAEESMNSVSLRRVADEALERLQQSGDDPTEPCWSVGVDVDARPRIPQEWYDEDTLLGDYLRAIQELQDDPRAQVLDPALCSHGDVLQVRPAAGLSDPDVRAIVLGQAAALGASLLRGESD
jgi:DNA repair exonuclease SbcCD nuclease subunit